MPLALTCSFPELPIIDEDLNISLDNDEQVETVALMIRGKSK